MSKHLEMEELLREWLKWDLTNTLPSKAYGKEESKKAFFKLTELRNKTLKIFDEVESIGITLGVGFGANGEDKYKFNVIYNVDKGTFSMPSLEILTDQPQKEVWDSDDWLQNQLHYYLHGEFHEISKDDFEVLERYIPYPCPHLVRLFDLAEKLAIWNQ